MAKKITIEARDVYKDYPLKRKSLFKDPEVVKAVRGVSFSLFKRETFGCVGESGCGKSTLSRMLIMLEKPTFGKVLYNGKNMHKAKGEARKQIRKRVQLVLQDPFLSLPPWMTVGDIVEDPLRIHGKKEYTKKDRREKVLQTLLELGLGEDAYYRYPESFSAGQRQMINIARAIILNPEIVILDEAVSALDVSVQAKILNLFSSLKEKRNLSYIIIAHDIGVVRHMCDRIGVMYLGKMVEIGDNEDIFTKALHPYTRALMNAVPTIDDGLRKKEVEVLRGEVPSPINIPKGCSFKMRCSKVMRICKKETPKLIEVELGHFADCHLYG